jgi:uncharacterized protein with NAD-binding domain and iron-sulfur cluster
MSKRVAILGGGIAGMTAAHELAERGFQVVVYEMRDIPGGKARSMPVPSSGTDGRRPLPGEHGFRFFPGFYRHIPDTMKRIPYRDRTVHDNLVPTEYTLIARDRGKEDLPFPSQSPGTPFALWRLLRAIARSDFGFRKGEIRHYLSRLLTLLISCKKRRFQQYEKISWWSFVGAEGRSEAFEKYCADGITRTCVACKAKEMSARTGGYVLLQLLFDFGRPGRQANRVLNGPTNEVWIQPWLDCLRQWGVEFHTGARVREIHFDPASGLVTGATIEEKGHSYLAQADYYIAALPVEVMEPAVIPETASRQTPLLGEAMKAHDPQLRKLARLRTAWMNGIMYYLTPDVPIVMGHVLYIDSDWALTSISQKQFWPDYDLKQHGNGQVEGILSVDISDWEKPSKVLQRPARNCDAREIKDEVLRQIKDALNDDSVKEYHEHAQTVDWFLDTAIQGANPNELENAEPLLINRARSWIARPHARTRIRNLFLAADYVRTCTDLATMESANEAARWAVNGILEESGSTALRCPIWPPREPLVFAPLRWYDRWHYRWYPNREPALLALLAAWFLCVPLWIVLYFVRSCWQLLSDWVVLPIATCTVRLPRLLAQATRRRLFGDSPARP